MKAMNTMKKNIVTFIICIIVLITLFISSVSAGYSSFCWSPFVEKTVAEKATISANILTDKDSGVEYIVVSTESGVAITPRLKKN